MTTKNIPECPDFVTKLSSDTQTAFRKIWKDTALNRSGIAAAKAKLSAYSVAAAEACNRNEFLDRDVCQVLIESCEKILDLSSESDDPIFVSAALSAAEYFMCIDDSEPDFEGIGSWDDDAKVMIAFLRHFDLIEKIPRDANNLLTTKYPEAFHD
jgi:hypothetical protein